MRHKILIATAAVAGVTLLVGLVTAFVMARSLTASAEEELARQALVTAELIDQDLEDLDFRPGDDVRQQIDRFRRDLNRSLERARVLGGHDVIEAVLRLPSRTVPITEPLVLIPALPPGTREGDVVTVDVDGKNMLVALEQVDLRRSNIVVAIGRAEPLLPVKEFTIVLLSALGIGAILTVGLGVWLARSLSTRLGGLSDAAAKVGAGDLSVRAPVSGGDEIADLSRSFNTMAGELEDVRTRERQFLMAVSHDLRTPLTTISGYAEALDSGDIDPEDLSRVAGVLHGQTGQLSRLVEDLMALARLDADEFELRPEQVDVTGVVRGVVETYQQRAEAASVELDTDCDGSVTAEVDPQRLVQVLSNLLDNALRYTPPGGDIAVSCSGASDGRATVEVTNSGPGIAPDDIPHVFERLYVADRYRAQRPAGSGLGLAIVDQLVTAMHGEVVCTSSAADGTAFSVTIGRPAPGSR